RPSQLSLSLPDPTAVRDSWGLNSAGSAAAISRTRSRSGCASGAGPLARAVPAETAIARAALQESAVHRAIVEIRRTKRLPVPRRPARRFLVDMNTFKPPLVAFDPVLGRPASGRIPRRSPGAAGMERKGRWRGTLSFHREPVHERGSAARGKS